MDNLSFEDWLEGDHWFLPFIGKSREAVATGHETPKTIRNHHLLSTLDRLVEGVMANPVSLREETCLIIAEYDRVYL